MTPAEFIKAVEKRVHENDVSTWGEVGLALSCAEIVYREAIALAVAAERERCAAIAESFIPSGFTSDGKTGDSYAVARDDRARTIAAAIRGGPELDD